MPSLRNVMSIQSESLAVMRSMKLCRHSFQKSCEHFDFRLLRRVAGRSAPRRFNLMLTFTKWTTSSFRLLGTPTLMSSRLSTDWYCPSCLVELNVSRHGNSIRSIPSLGRCTVVEVVALSTRVGKREGWGSEKIIRICV